ncbi:MAG: ABC transporter permease [Deltaproteobacteria bacterium]|nr:MAG: ABC transporter permease [Deltaproteobacteria bacterium]
MSSKQIVSRLYRVVKRYKLTLLTAITFMLLLSVFTGIQAVLIRDLIDDIFIAKNILMLKLLPLIVIVVFTLKSVCYYTYRFLLEKVGQSIIRDMRIMVFEHIHRQSLSFFEQMPTGTLISRIISDINLMQQAVSRALVGLLRDLTQTFILLGVVFYMNWRLAMLTFVIIPLAAWPIIKFGKIFRKLSTKSQEETAQMSNLLHETITGSRIVKAFSREEYEGGRFRIQVVRLFQVIIREARYRSMQHPMMEMIGGLAAALLIWFGGRQVIYGQTTPGAFFAFFTALIAAYDPIKRVSEINSTIQQGLASAARVFSILDIEPEICNAPDAAALPKFGRLIQFKSVSFKYEDDNEVLSNINLTVPAGQTLAIVGASGGGKTTLTNLIPRFLDVKEGNGSILIDGIDIRKVSLASLRGQISLVTQQTILFNDTVRNNIAYGNPKANNDEIRKAAHAAHALKFIENLPDGFSTCIGEGGARLSGGERQRISIARAILKNAPILILDEATSALDTESEHEVQKALENLMKNKTTLIIAHRLSTIKNADRIIVIKKGRIVEEGSHQQLLDRHGEYELLYNMQYR